MKKIVKKEFELFIKDTFKGKEDVQNFLLKHSMRHRTESNLVKNINDALGVKRYDIKLLKQFIRDITRLFCLQALREKQQALNGKQTAGLTNDGHISLTAPSPILNLDI
jgi:hypothetical protein